MGFRFRKRIKLIPGLWVNLSKKGGSLSVGGHGLTANMSKKGVRETVGLPGSGISYQTRRVGLTQRHGLPRRRLRRSATPASMLAFIAVAVIILWVLAHLH
jgi:hypothetical protein